MSQVGSAVRALDLRPPHEQAAVLFLVHAFLADRRPETWPARTGLVFRVPGEYVRPTHSANVNARAVIVPVFSGEGSLSPLVDADVVLKRRELSPELRLVLLLYWRG